MVLHVDELSKDLLSNPRDIFAEPSHDGAAPPMPMEDGPAGIGDLPEEMALEERPPELEEPEAEEELEGIKLSVDPP